MNKPAIFIALFLQIFNTSSFPSFEGQEAKELESSSRNLSNGTCEGGKFSCFISGACIPWRWTCDGEKDCPDGSDEEESVCENRSCSPEEWSCPDECVPLSWVCDHHKDCSDGSDERECTTTCLQGEFTCDSGLCIQPGWKCDGEDDCGDGSDEEGCELNQCERGEVRCKSGCVKTSNVCDGDADCAGGEDEIGCGEKIGNRTEQCHPGEFQCLEQHFCVHSSWTCDGDKDCPQGSDESEEVCGKKNKCEGDRIKCEDGHCVNQLSECDKVLDCESDVLKCSQKKKKKTKVIQDITGNNVCSLWPPVCSQVCHPSPFGHKCDCFPGYVRDPHKPRSCKSEEGHTSLLFAHKTDIRKISLDRPSLAPIVNTTRSSCAVDYNFRTGMVFWSDLWEEKIYTAPIDSGAERTVVISSGVVTVDGLAVDWVYSHLYWTDTGTDSISVADLSGTSRAVLIQDHLEEPRAITVHPGKGWMFWSDWGSTPKIERAGMDGSNRKAILTDSVRWPNGLTVDLTLDLLYWVDAKLNTINCANLDGSHHRVILSSSQHLKHPFSVSVFADHVYWTEWDTHAIYQAEKFTGSNVTVVTSTDAVRVPMGVQVYHPYRQPNYPNLCLPFNGHCSHFCLPAPQMKTSCACPEQLILGEDNTTCQVAVEILRPPSISHVKESLSASLKTPIIKLNVQSIGTVLLGVLLLTSIVVIVVACRRDSAPLLNLDNTDSSYQQQKVGEVRKTWLQEIILNLQSRQGGTGVETQQLLEQAEMLT